MPLVPEMAKSGILIRSVHVACMGYEVNTDRIVVGRKAFKIEVKLKSLAHMAE
jgi:hypothetical protein